MKGRLRGTQLAKTVNAGACAGRRAKYNDAQALCKTAKRVIAGTLPVKPGLPTAPILPKDGGNSGPGLHSGIMPRPVVRSRAWEPSTIKIVGPLIYGDRLGPEDRRQAYCGSGTMGIEFNFGVDSAIVKG